MMRLLVFCTAVFVTVFPAISMAQSPYAAAIKVNGRAVTYFEIEQRAMFLRALGTPGDLVKQARLDLIDDRLRVQAAVAQGATVSEDALQAGMTEFAARANLTTEQLLQGLATEGIAPETFRDFVRAGMLWRQVVQTRFQGKAFVSETELEAALALGTTAIRDSVLLTELVLPFDNGQEAQSRALADDFSRRLKSFSAFEEAAAAFSAAPSRAQGGKLDWTPLASLAPVIATKLLALSVGEITAPIELPNAVVLYQLRGIRSGRTVAARTVSVDYARLLIPGGRTSENLQTAVDLAAGIDTCEDLHAKAEKYPGNSFSRDVLPVGKVPKAIARELEELDNNEVSTNLTQGEDDEFLMFLMLCGRTGALAEGDREQIRNALFGQRLEAFGVGFLQELKGDAILEFR